VSAKRESARRVLRLAVLAVSTWAAAAVPAPARDIPRAEGFGGYSYGRVEDEGLHGWTATLGYNLNYWLELETELAGHHGRFGNGTDVGRLSILAGPRVNFRVGRTTPFVRMLAGAVRTTTGITVQDVDISARATDLGGAAGAGIDVGVGRRWGLRVHGDYFLLRSQGQTIGDPRAAFGLSYRLGARRAAP
jgi:hypothetical protein